MQILSSWAINLSLPGLQIYPNSRFSTAAIKPIRDISPRRFNKGGSQSIRDIFLDEICQIVHLPKKGDPTVIGSVVVADFFTCVVSLLDGGDGEVLFEVVRRDAHVWSYIIIAGAWWKLHILIYSIENIMKFSETAKFQPGMFVPQTEEDI